MNNEEFVRQRVFDPIQRVLHWWIGATVMALAGLGWVEKVLDVGAFKQSATTVHIALGFALAVGFLLRAVWGVIGPDQAQFKAHWRAIKSLAIDSTPKDAGPFGYEGVAALAYAGFYLAVTCAVISGLLLAGMRYDQGPFASSLFDELAGYEVLLTAHNVSLYAATLFVLAHIAGMIRHEKKSEVPVAQSMISGYQYRIVTRKEGES